MPGHGPPVNEAELHGFVDGDMDRGRRESVQTFLAASPGDAARVETWRRQNERFVPLSRRSKPGHCRGSCRLLPAPGEWPRRDTLPGRQAEATGSHAWRARWFARLIGLSFASGALLAASAAYLAGRGERAGSRAAFQAPAPAGMNDTFVTRAVGAPGI
jgi:anti-sigma factor RsiW